MILVRQFGLTPQPVELGIVVVLPLLLGAREAACQDVQGVVVAPGLPETGTGHARRPIERRGRAGQRV